MPYLWEKRNDAPKRGDVKSVIMLTMQTAVVNKPHTITGLFLTLFVTVSAESNKITFSIT